MGTEGDDVRVIAGRYRLEARLGRGGMGIVWRATDELLGRRVAVKEILLDEGLDAARARRQRDRTLREARAVAQLRHPHIIVVHDVVADVAGEFRVGVHGDGAAAARGDTAGDVVENVVEHGGRLYIVMELIEGGSLADRVARHGPVDPPEAARIGLALLGALRAAHRAGVLHRDIKPANVLVESGTGRVVLTDFGIAQVAGATTLTETGSFVGSPEYTAPERMSGARTGPESDLWSLGALLCTALSGESPFRRDSLGGILHAVVTAEIRTPPQAEPLLPLVRGLLERDPDLRLDAEPAERMLQTFLDTGRLPAPTTPGPLRREAGRPAATGYPVAERGLPGPAAPAVPRRGWGRSPRSVLVAVLLVAAMAGAGASAVALLVHRGGGGGGTPTPPATTSTAPAGSTTGTRGPGSPAAGPSGGRSPSPAGRTTAPSGFRLADDPAGFSLAVPDGFTRSVQGDRVVYLSPGGAARGQTAGTFRLGVKVAAPEPGGPFVVLRRADAAGPDTNPGYRDGRVTGTRHRGHPAALWEFTWNGFSAAEGPRHTYDLSWEEGGRMYDVWVSAPVGKVREAREYFDVAVDTFTRG
ncbi:serine/threonine-protein kinase [Streptomyces sp. MS06]|uniref:serine/threonine-protein kinase n=1 Tax=Streptomyces sp. MS06 TaxID=3385974 RepID=UPI0039A34883